MDRTQAKWERKLKKYGLANSQLESQGVQIRALPPSTGIQPYQFDSELDITWMLQAMRHLGFEETARLHQIPVRDYQRPIPLWANSDFSIRRIIWQLYPNWPHNIHQLRAASTFCAIIYRYFRLMEPAAQIASDLGISPAALKFRIARIRKLAPSLLLLDAIERAAVPLPASNFPTAATN